MCEEGMIIIFMIIMLGYRGSTLSGIVEEWESGGEKYICQMRVNINRD